MPRTLRNNRSTPYSSTQWRETYEQTLRACRDAIARKDLPHNIQPYQIEIQENYADQAREAFRWIQESKRIQLVHEYQAYWDIGEILHTVQRTLEQQNPEMINAAYFTQTSLEVTDRQARTARRIYKIFAQYPTALQHIKEIPISYWNDLNNNELDLLAANIAIEFETYQIVFEDIHEENSSQEETDSSPEPTSETEFGHLIMNPQTGEYDFQYVSTWAEHLEEITRAQTQDQDQPGTPDSEATLVPDFPEDRV